MQFFSYISLKQKIIKRYILQHFWYTEAKKITYIHICNYIYIHIYITL